METMIALVIGIGLSATCGFRVFVPLLGMSIGVHYGYITPAANFAWVGSWAAMIAFSIATICEIAGYFLPWFDNVLDMITTPAAVIAGVIATASLMGEVSPFVQWSVAIIGGGGTAGAVQGGTVFLRGVSSASTGGIGNPLIALGELISSIVGTILAIVLPILALFMIAIVVFFVMRWAFREKKKQAATTAT